MENFTLFDGPIALAHHHWKKLVKKGDTVIDATCGNGHDTLYLAQLALTADTGQLVCMDIQDAALEKTRNRLLQALPQETAGRVHFLLQNHSVFPSLAEESVTLIVYNLGYLPGSDKQIKTQANSTLDSLAQAQPLIQPGGLICVTAYPGHPEGAEEENKLLHYLSTWNKNTWSVCHHRWINRGGNAPSLFLIQSRK